MKQLKILLIFLILILPSACKAAGEEELAKTGFYSTPENILQKLDNDKAGYKEHFLMGLSCKKTGESKKAIFHFANSCFMFSRNPKLKIYPYTVYRFMNGLHIKSGFYDDAVYETASLFNEYKEFEYTIKFIDLIGKSNTALFRDAVILKSNAMMELNKNDEAIALLNGLLTKYEDKNSRSLIYIRIASAYERNEDFSNAIKGYFNILSLSTKIWQATVACDRILEIKSKISGEITNKEYFLLGAALYNNSRYRDSVEYLKYSLLHESGRMPADLTEHALNYLVKAYIGTGRNSEAENLILKYKDNGNSLLYNGLLKAEADTLWSMKKKQQAFVIYQKLYKEAADGILNDSHKRIVEFLISRNDKSYIKFLDDYKEKYPKDRDIENYLWIIIKENLKAKDFKSAIEHLEESLVLFPGGPNSGRNRYWLVKLYTVSGRTASGRTADIGQKIKEMAVFNPDSAYTWKLLEQIKDNYKSDDINNKFKESVAAKNAESALFYHILLLLKEKDFAERDKRIQSMEFIDKIKKYQEFDNILNKSDYDTVYKENFKGIEKYFSIGYTDGILRETGIIPNGKEFQADKYKALAYLGGKYNNYYLALTSILKLFKDYHLAENITLLPATTVAKLFPRAFSDHVETGCSEKNIPKEMAYAVMKAESSFNHKAISSAGASGLMQLMPSTAKGIARGLKMKDYELKDPLNSISFGITYLSWLNKMFKGDFENIVAGYNAGAGNVKKWIKEINNDDDDYFIEFIPFDETRSYILRTNRFLIQYRLIYNSSNFEKNQLTTDGHR